MEVKAMIMAATLACVFAVGAYAIMLMAVDFLEADDD